MPWLFLALAFAWAYGLDKIEDRLPPTSLGYLGLVALCVANPFTWLFFWSIA
jgi:hypothetical protein